MYQTTLRQWLVDPGITPAIVPRGSTLCLDWFKNEASLISFVIAGVFRDLIARGWDDPQGVPVDEWNRFVADVVPRMVAVLDAQPAGLQSALEALALAYHSSL